MDARLTTTHGTWRLLTATFVALALLVTLGATSASAAKSASCSVKDTDSGRTYTRLQAAVDAAKPAAHLIVLGTCHGGTLIDKSVVIVGERARQRGRPILDGDHHGRVMGIRRGVQVKIRDLTIQDGLAKRLWGGAILNRGHLELRDVVLRRNRAHGGGGGIYNEGGLRIAGDSHIRSNHAGYNGGSGASFAAGLFNRGIATLTGTSSIRNAGILAVDNRGTLVMDGSSSIGEGTIGVRNGGTMMMNGRSRIGGNQHEGVWNDRPLGSLTLNDASSISGNGSGVDNYYGSVTMSGSSAIHHNTGKLYSRVGGVSNIRGSVTMSGSSSIHHNTGLGVGTKGGTVTMSGSSSIHHNTSSVAAAGGLVSLQGTLVGVYCAPQTYANVYDNSPDDCYIEP